MITHQSLSPSLADRFDMILDGILRVVAARGARDRAQTALLVLVWVRVRRAMTRFRRMVEGVRRVRVSVGSPVVADRARPEGAARVRVRLPSGFGWLVRMMAPDDAAQVRLCGYRSQLVHLLAEADMVALMASVPGIGRVLRPLCQALMIELPAALVVAKRVRRLRPAPMKRDGEMVLGEPDAAAPAMRGLVAKA